MKKILSVLLVCCMLAPLPVLANNPVSVTLDGKPIAFDVPAEIIGNRTMVPMRRIFELYSAHVEWFASSRIIIATLGPLMITMQIDSPTMTVSNVLTEETKLVTLDVPPCIVPLPDDPYKGRTLVPVRAISESIGLLVDWNDETRTVIITTPQNAN